MQQLIEQNEVAGVTVRERLEWVVPVISEMPLKELTQSGSIGSGTDFGFYS